MENAVHALKIGAAILAFAIAIATTFMVFAQARQVSEAVLFAMDNDSYMEYVEGDRDTNNRIVGLETIIPIIYNYYKGEYTVTIKMKNGTEYIFDSSKKDPDTGKFLDGPGMIAKLDNFVDNNLSTLKNKKFEESFYKYTFKGAIYTDPDTGETIEDKNTRTMIDITYKEL